MSSMQDLSSKAGMPRKIRVSSGSAVVLGLSEGMLDALPTTAYLLTYRRSKCVANCGFCPQASGSQGRGDLLSRVSWPVYLSKLVLEGLERAVRDNKIRRVCLQALNYSRVFGDLLGFVKAICEHVEIPVSVSCQPLTRRNMVNLAKAGAERISIPLDAATKEIFNRVKGSGVGGPYVWDEQIRLLGEAVSVFGEGMVSTHLIVGLGETEKEMVEMIQRCVDMGVLPALFAFTPILGTALEKNSQPQVSAYRRVQLSRYLIFHRIARCDNLSFDEKDRVSDFGIHKAVLIKNIQTGEPFQTFGCPDCNRPYYNEKPSGPLYNYPRSLKDGELKQILKELGLSKDS